MERWFAELTEKKLRRSSHNFVKELVADISAWVDSWNRDPKPYKWGKAPSRSSNQ